MPGWESRVHDERIFPTGRPDRRVNPAEPGVRLRPRPSDVGAALALLRIVMGVDFLLHGLGRMPILAAFAAGVTKQFSHSILPAALVTAWAYAIPPIEIVLGLLLVLGLALRPTLLASGAYMGVLICGQVLVAGYAAILEEQMYLAIFAALLAAAAWDRFTLDPFRKRREVAPERDSRSS